MGFDVDVTTFLVGITGLAFAAILSSVGYLYRGWLESRRSARKVLYLLLEIRYALSVSFFNAHSAKEEYIKHYSLHLKEKGINVEIKDIARPIESEVNVKGKARTVTAEMRV